VAQREEVRRLPGAGSPNRIPPHNLDAEQSVLGAMMESKAAISNVVEILRDEDFYKPAHAEIFLAIVALDQRSQAVDAITVAEELSRRGMLEDIGGKPYLHGLLEAYPTASAATKYAQIVEEHARLRRLVGAGNEIQEIGFSLPEDVDQAVDQAEEIIYNVADRRLRDSVKHLRGLLSENMEALEKLADRGESVTGVSTGFPDLDDYTSGFQPSNFIVVAARPGMGKCLAEDSLVCDPSTGEQLTIRRFVEEKRQSILSLNSEGSLKPAAVTDWIDNGVRPCFKLTTRLGRTIEATDNHPFLTVDGWTPLADLGVGRKIAIAADMPVEGDGSSWSKEQIRLLAYYLAEGGLTGTVPRFTNGDPEIVADFEACVSSAFPEVTVRRETPFTYVVRQTIRRRSPNDVTLWLRDLGLMGKNALQKRFVDEVWRFSQPQMAEFLKALFSCDGTIYSMQGYGRIEFTVASEGLAEDVHKALLRFGIIAKLWRKTERSWRVEITEPTSIQIYQAAIGWLGEKTRRIYRDSVGPRHTNNGHLPQEVWTQVRKAAESAGLSLSELSRRAGESMSNVHTNRGLPRVRLARYAEILDSDDLRWLASTDLYWDQIIAIEPVGSRRVFDLTIPESHNFVAEGIVVHNSSLLNDFALSCALKTRKPVMMFNLEMSRHELTRRFLASEAKVDSQRMNKGTLQERDWIQLSSALGRLAEAPIYIDDSANITLMEIRAKCRRLKAREGLGMVIIDYLQLMQSPRRSENRQQEVSDLSRNLKILARELEVPVICAAQLNRAVEYRADKRPLLGDLRESGSIEQDSDVVMFIYRDELYNPDSEHRGEAELIIAKHRNGPTGTIRLAFMNQFTKFASMARVPGGR
jgi:replicative DNA helicase